MTDKEKIREEVVRMHNLLPVMDGYNIYVNYADRICTTLEMYIDSLQEEPVSERFAFKAIPRLLEMIEPTDRAKAYIAKLADALEVEGYSTDAKIVRESLKIMNGEKVPMATMDEEPVSEDLEEAANDYAHDLLHDDVFETFIAGAKWKEEQMMKDAVYGLVCGHDESSPAWIDLNLLNKPNIKVGTEVKLIIIKDE